MSSINGIVHVIGSKIMVCKKVDSFPSAPHGLLIDGTYNVGALLIYSSKSEGCECLG